MAELRRLLARHAQVESQIKEIEAARAAALAAAPADTNNEVIKMIALLVSIYGIAADTATILVVECLSRTFPNVRAVGSYAGMTGTPFDSGGSRREQGISKNGNPRLRKCLMQLAWRWLRLHPDHALSRWFRERTHGAARGARIRKVMIVALARKLLVLLWKLVTTGEIPQDVRLKAA